ncbi:MAG: AMP-binding enzyme [Acidimicrobiales bacterium]
MVKERLGPWAAPRELVLVDSLPRTSIGKVRRDHLERGAAAGPAGA